jgi:hypothetical protein
MSRPFDKPKTGKIAIKVVRLGRILKIKRWRKNK